MNYTFADIFSSHIEDWLASSYCLAEISSETMTNWFLTKSLNEFRKPTWFPMMHITCGVRQTSIC